MNKILSRLLIFFVGLPLVVGIVFLKPYNHLALHILILLVSIGGANELYNIFALKTKLLPKPLVLCLTAFIPLCEGLFQILPSIVDNFPVFSNDVSTFALLTAFVVLLFSEIITAKDFDSSIQEITSSSFIILYTGYLITFISRMTTIKIADENISTPLIATFLVMVFMCDSFAWLFGVLFGKNNRGFIKASPNKSIVGFIGGWAGSVLTGIGAWFLWPEIFTGSILKIIVVGLLIALSAEIGDLIESIIKRSAQVKDSGSIIPGRGGLLDSIDSIILASPVFYLLIQLFYGPLI